MHARLLPFVAALACAISAVAADAPAPKAEAKAEAKELFNGKNLQGWKSSDFGGEGEIEIKDGQIIAHEGASLTGVQYTNSVPTNNFVITLEAMKIDGSDFFCALTFPFDDSHCSLIMGGWGGGVVGLSSMDSMDASENETTKYVTFAKNKWYKVKLEVRPNKIQAWIDDEKIIDADTKDHKISLRPGAIEIQVPLGLSAYQTKSAWRNIRLANLPPAPAKKP